jgi:hypothetical protein
VQAQVPNNLRVTVHTALVKLFLYRWAAIESLLPQCSVSLCLSPVVANKHCAHVLHAIKFSTKASGWTGNR